MSNNLVVGAVTIANGQSLSSAVVLGEDRLVGIAMPADWTAANLTFQVSHDGSTYNNLYDDSGAEITVTAADDRYIALDLTVFAGIQDLKIRSGTSGTPVNQGAERTITLVTRPV